MHCGGGNPEGNRTRAHATGNDLSKVPDRWPFWNRVQLDFIRPGKLTDNAPVEAFHGSLRRECPSQRWWVDPAEAQRTLGAWRAGNDNVRPHSR